MATKKKSTARITLRTVLQHVQRQHHVVLAKIGGLQTDVLAVRQDMAGMERRLSRQIENIDKRLDDIEIVQIPMLKKAVGIR